jgi:hypothetical protein
MPLASFLRLRLEELATVMPGANFSFEYPRLDQALRNLLA